MKNRMLEVSQYALIFAVCQSLSKFNPRNCKLCLILMKETVCMGLFLFSRLGVLHSAFPLNLLCKDRLELNKPC